MKKIFSALFIALNLSTAFANKEDDLIKAIKSDNIDKMKSLVASGMKLDFSSSDPKDRKNTPLIIACGNAKVDAVKILLEGKADPNFGHPLTKWSPLMCMLVSAGNNIQYYAMVEKYGKKEGGANIEVAPLIDTAKVTQIVKLLLEAGADAKYVQPATNETPLHKAAAYNFASVCAYLVDKGASVNAEDIKGRTPLVAAAMNNSTKTVLFLVNRGCDVNKRYSEITAAGDFKDNTVLMDACYWGMTDLVKILIDKKVDVNAVREGTYKEYSYGVAQNTTTTTLVKENALVIASERNFTQIVEILKQAGAHGL